MGFRAALLITSILAAAAQAAASTVSERLQECARITDRDARLACFDRLAANLAMPSKPAEWSTVAGWKVSRQVNPLDDTTTIAAMLVAQDTGAWVSAPVTLILRCQSGRIEAYINWGVNLGRSAIVTWRAGAGRATAEQWTVSTDGLSTFCPSNEEALVRQMMRVDRFVARVTPPGGTPITAVFVMDGIGDAVGPLLAACGGD